MTAARFHLSREQLFDASGNPLAGGRLYFYVTGTTTELATYSNAGLTSANSHPVVADSAGRVGDIFLQDQVYRVQLRDAADTLIWDTDNVYKDVTFVRAPALPAAAFPNMLVHNTADGKRYRRNAASTAWIDEGPIDSVGNTAGVTDVVAGTSAGLFATPDSVAGLWERGTDIALTGAGPNTLALPATGGGYFEVSGTTAVAGINSQRSGLEVELRFQGAVQLTHSSSFALIGGANITTEAGDLARFRNVSAVGTSGTDWRMVGYTRTTGEALLRSSIATKTSSYAVVDADRGGVIRFAGLTGNVTLSLPAASGRAGFLLWVVHEDTIEATAYAVTVDPASTETVDGVQTKAGYGGTRICLHCDGSVWRTISGNWVYNSGLQTIVVSGEGSTLTLAHGLGRRPLTYQTFLRCQTAQHNYSIGDIVPVPVTYTYGTAGGSIMGASIVADATNLNVRYGDGGFVIPIKTTGAVGAITVGNWRYIIVAID